MIMASQKIGLIGCSRNLGFPLPKIEHLCYYSVKGLTSGIAL